ncbi:MAG: 2-amino-4-hydroxy-6-hydroxymethyldihydropteridine diphosphokinase [Myxococcota bacterium]
MARAYVGLGSNLGDRFANLRAARRALDAPPELRAIACSSIYETEPVDAPPPSYLNAVCAVETTLEPETLLARLLAIEASLGRTRSAAGAPRTIDLDLLLYGERAIATPTLRVPHPRLHARAFALVPLLEIAPDARDPAGEPLANSRASAAGLAVRIGRF